MRIYISFTLNLMNAQMINIAVCDDDKAMLDLIYSELLMTFHEKLSISIKLYTQPQLLITDADNQSFDLIFLDIELPGINGFQLAEKLQVKIPNAFLVFISNYDNFIYPSFEFQPLWFLRKSSLKEELPEVVRKYLKQTEFNRASYDIPFGVQNQSLLIKDITYFECIGRQITVNTIYYEKIEFIGKLKKIENQFEKYHFIRIHNSYLVSHRHIFSLEEEVVVLIDQTKLPISKHRRKEVKNLLVKYIEM